MGFEQFIAWKHLTRRRKTGFISLVTLISVGGVAVGVMALIVVLAVMSGFDRELKSKIVNVQPHLRIEKINGIDNPAADIEKIKALPIPGIQSAAGFIEGQAILKSSANATGVIVKGIDSQNEDISIYQKDLRRGEFYLEDEITHEVRRRFFFFKKVIEHRTGGIMIGEGLALRLGLDVGDQVTLITPFQDPERANTFSLDQSEARLFSVRGIFRLGMNDFDSALALIDLKQAQEMYHLENRVTGISVRFHEVDDAEKYKLLVRQNLTQDYFVRSWYDMNHNFFQALKVEKSVMTILLALIILVAAFNIVASLTMVVMEKTKDIGILRALGATRGAVRRIFVTEGFSIGFLGVMSGTGLGLWMAFNLNPISDFLKNTFGLEVFPSDIYYFDRIPAQINPQDVVFTVVFAVIASVLAGFYPAHRASHLSPIEALRYE